MGETEGVDGVGRTHVCRRLSRASRHAAGAPRPPARHHIRHVSRQSRTTSQSLERESAKSFKIPSSFFSFFGRWPDFFKGQIRFLFPTLIFKQQLFRSLSILHRIKLEKVGKLGRDDVMAF